MGEAKQPGERPAAMLRLPGEWVERGLCRKVDPELFFPAAGKHPTAAKRVCGRCPVRADCLAWALDANEEFGVWGGTSEQERRRMRAKQRNSTPDTPQPAGQAASGGGTRRGERRRGATDDERNATPVLQVSGEVEVDRTVQQDGCVKVAGNSGRVGSAYAGRRVTLRLDGRLMYVIAEGILIGTWPCPIDSDKVAVLQGARPPAGLLPPPQLPEGPLRVQRRVRANGTITIAKQNIRLGTRHAGVVVTVIIEDTHLRVLHGEEEIADYPRPDSTPTTRVHTTQLYPRNPSSIV